MTFSTPRLPEIIILPMTLSKSQEILNKPNTTSTQDDPKRETQQTSGDTATASKQAKQNPYDDTTTITEDDFKEWLSPHRLQNGLVIVRDTVTGEERVSMISRIKYVKDRQEVGSRPLEGGIGSGVGFLRLRAVSDSRLK